MPFDRWNQAVSSAADADAQRTLLAEIGTWRARNLTDIPAQRDAAFALSTLHRALGREDDALREARSLMSLCQTPPEASGEELRAAKSLLRGMGAKPVQASATPKRKGRPEPKPRNRSERSERSERTERPDRSQEAVAAALELAAKGAYDDALKRLKGKRHKDGLARVWVELAKALAAEGDDRDALLGRLDRRLRQSLGLPTPKSPRKVEAHPPAPEDGALGQLIGRRLPKRREAFLRALEAWADEHADQLDTLASTALQHHIDTTGPDHAAPWLAAFVARALASGGEATAAVLERNAGQHVVSIYEESPFQRALPLIQAASGRFSGLRRSVLSRNAEPAGRHAWTVRFDDGEKMLVLAPAADEPYPDTVAAEMAARLPFLCARVVVLAPGSANAPLREAVAAAGMMTLDGEPSDTELLSALDRVSPVERPDRQTKKAEPKAPRAEKAKPAPAPPAVDPMKAVVALLDAEAVPSVEALTEALGGLRKLRDAFLHANTSWATLPADASARLDALLAAADATAPASLRIPEATTLSLKVAAAQGGPVADRLAAGGRFSGPGISDVVDVVKAAADAGWTIRRAFRGTTRRERRNQPVLEALSGALDGVWRLGLEKGDTRTECWFVAELPIEGRAAIPQLLLDDRKRVVVLPIDADLTAWYATLDAPAAIGWTGDDGEALAEALNAL